MRSRTSQLAWTNEVGSEVCPTAELEEDKANELLQVLWHVEVVMLSSASRGPWSQRTPCISIPALQSWGEMAKEARGSCWHQTAARLYLPENTSC